MTGCVQLYHPMSGMHRPVVVNTQAPNFQDLHLTVYCVPGGMLTGAESRVLCDNVSRLFENQGAQVNTVTSVRQLQGDAFGGRISDSEGEDAAPPTTDLILELRSRLVHKSNDPILWALCISTFTLVPAVTESTFAQDVTIRDGNGFLLHTDSLQGRLVRRFGVTAWAGTKLVDRFWRDDSEKLGGDAANRDLSKDLYGQLSQLVFNAKMQWQVLEQAEGSTWK